MSGGEKGTILVSGVTGYIGAWVAKEFLDNGYKVRGTVRDVNKSKGKEHIKRWQDEGLPIDLVKNDLLDAEAWFESCKGVDYVAHVASPFDITFGPKEAEEKLFKPARDGTLNVLRAAKSCGVKKVIVTSSIAAMYRGKSQKDFDGIEPEEVWSETEGDYQLYEKSKTLAELAAWEFIEKAKESGEKIFEMATINPSLVVGPPVSKGSATSHDFPKKLLGGELPGFSRFIPELFNNIVDVRDVALAHRLALEKEEANGQRFVCAAHNNLSLPEWAKRLKPEFSRYGYKFGFAKIPNGIIRMYASLGVDPQVSKLKAKFGNKEPEMSNAKIQRVLGIKFRELDTTLSEHVHGCLQVGVSGFKQKKKYKNALEKNEIDKVEM